MLSTLIKILVIFSVLFYGTIIICEKITRKKPNWKISKWWRKHIIAECEKCE